MLPCPVGRDRSSRTREFEQWLCAGVLFLHPGLGHRFQATTVVITFQVHRDVSSILQSIMYSTGYIAPGASGN